MIPKYYWGVVMKLRQAFVCLCAVPIYLLSSSAWSQMEEVVVTTRKRAENLQDVPIAVSALTAEQISRQGIVDLTGVTKLDPSVLFDTSFGNQDTRITIRGLSNTRGRSNVAFLVDGIDVTTENSISAGSGLLANKRLLNDVERIELVKGPQSALYGRAAFSGAISYITKEPGDELEGNLRLDVGDYGRRQIDASVGGPLIDDVLGVRVTGVYWNEDGYYQNSTSGTDVGAGDGFGTALTSVFTPNDTFKVKARVEYSEDEFSPAPTVRITGSEPTLYPQSAFDAQVGVSSAFSGTATNLFDFGVYCPGVLPIGPSTSEVLAAFPNHPLIDDPNNPGQQIPAPGFCSPSTYGNATKKQVTHSENPITGEDYPGDTVDLLRGSILVDWEVGKFNLSSYTGFTDSSNTQHYDQDYQAVGRPDQLISVIFTNTEQDTRQFSQELRFSSNWDFPVNFTLGGLYWEEDRDLVDNNGIYSCLPFTTNTAGDLLPATAGVCDGTAALGGLVSVRNWQEYAQQNLRPELPGFRGAVWETDTEHWSVYLSIEWDITESLKLTLENRTIWEDLDLLRPNQSACGQLGFSTAGGFLVVPLVSEAANPGTAVHCVAWDNAVKKIRAGLDPNFDILSPGVQNNDWALIQGRESTDFHTPKITVEWSVTDDALIYGYWARAQKPGGINQLEAGAAATTIENERFLPEVMDAYELGLKSSWEVKGFLQANASLFFQDYTDKQITTQIIVNDLLTPRVTNASAAEVFGLELNLSWQPEFFEGLSLSAAYTWLDATYEKFDDDTTILVRAAAANACDVVYKGAGGPNPSDLSDPANGGPTCRIDQSGKQLERTPEHSFSSAVSLQRNLPSSQFDWLLELNATYQDERFVDPDNYTRWDDYWLVDFRAGLLGEKMDFIVYVDNLLDDDTLKTGGSGPDFGEGATNLGFVAGLGVQQYFGSLPAPRVLGARLNYRF